MIDADSMTAPGDQWPDTRTGVDRTCPRSRPRARTSEPSRGRGMWAGGAARRGLTQPFKMRRLDGFGARPSAAWLARGACGPLGGAACGPGSGRLAFVQPVWWRRTSRCGRGFGGHRSRFALVCASGVAAFGLGTRSGRPASAPALVVRGCTGLRALDGCAGGGCDGWERRGRRADKGRGRGRLPGERCGACCSAGVAGQWWWVRRRTERSQRVVAGVGSGAVASALAGAAEAGCRVEPAACLGSLAVGRRRSVRAGGLAGSGARAVPLVGRSGVIAV
jgi:hypothetical protein